MYQLFPPGPPPNDLWHDMYFYSSDNENNDAMTFSIRLHGRSQTEIVKIISSSYFADALWRSKKHYYFLFFERVSRGAGTKWYVFATSLPDQIHIYCTFVETGRFWNIVKTFDLIQQNENPCLHRSRVFFLGERGYHRNVNTRIE